MNRAVRAGKIVLISWMLILLFSVAANAAPSISAKKMTLAVGGKQTLKMKGLPKSRKVIWKSAKPSVARVTAKGVVTGVKPGKTTVTAAAGGKRYACVVTVRRITLSAAKGTLNKGESLKLSLKGAPKGTKAVWKSTSTAVASVSGSGLVSAVGNGSAKIKATSCGKTFTCTVTVRTLSMNISSISMQTGGTYQLKVIGALKASEKVTWSSSSSSVAKVSGSGLVTGVGTGNTAITAKVGKTVLSCNISVNTTARISTNLVTLQKGGSYVLSVTGASGPVTWKSSNSSVASVSSAGKVTGVSPGVAQIKATAGSSSFICNVTVKEASTTTVVRRVTTTVTTTTPVTGVTDNEVTTLNTTGDTGSSSGRVTYASGSMENTVYTKLMSFKKKYPEGMTFTNADYRSWVGGIYRGGYGCAGFCFELSDACFAPNLAVMRVNNLTTNLRPGDIIRLDYNTHSVIVTEVYSDSVVVAEANYNSSVHWGRRITFSEIRQTGTNVITRYQASTAADVKAVMAIRDTLPVLW